jgi:hypothetical protein
MRTVITLLLAAALLGCASSRQVVLSTFVTQPVIVATHAPGFVGPSSWVLRVSADGQVERVVDDGLVTTVFRESSLTPNAIAGILLTARVEGFYSSLPLLAAGVTDQATVSLELIDGPRHHRVEVYGPVAQPDVPELQAFLATWRALIELCPPPTPGNREGGPSYYQFSRVSPSPPD